MPTGRVAAVSRTYRVRAVKWPGGWELHIAGEGVTQVRTLDKAAEQVRLYLATLHDNDFDGVRIDVAPDLGELGDEVAEARRSVRAAAEAQQEAARKSRAIAARLRREGFSVTDSAAVLGVSRGRVSQLVRRP